MPALLGRRRRVAPAEHGADLVGRVARRAEARHGERVVQADGRVVLVGLAGSRRAAVARQHRRGAAVGEPGELVEEGGVHRVVLAQLLLRLEVVGVGLRRIARLRHAGRAVELVPRRGAPREPEPAGERPHGDKNDDLA